MTSPQLLQAAKSQRTEAEVRTLRAAAQEAEAAFETTLRAKYPRADRYTFYRAEEAVKAGRADRWDREMGTDAEIIAAHDAYVAALHRYYESRDGKAGFLSKYESTQP